MNINISLTMRHIVTSKRNKRKEGKKEEKKIKEALCQYTIAINEHGAVIKDLQTYPYKFAINAF